MKRLEKVLPENRRKQSVSFPIKRTRTPRAKQGLFFLSILCLSQCSMWAAKSATGFANEMDEQSAPPTQSSRQDPKNAAAMFVHPSIVWKWIWLSVFHAVTWTNVSMTNKLYARARAKMLNAGANIVGSMSSCVIDAALVQRDKAIFVLIIAIVSRCMLWEQIEADVERSRKMQNARQLRIPTRTNRTNQATTKITHLFLQNLNLYSCNHSLSTEKWDV